MSTLKPSATLSPEERGAQPPTLRAGAETQLQNYFPLSFAQQRLWFLNQLQPASTAYNMSAALELEGELEISALERRLCEIVRRHEALRTTFNTVEEEPVQVVASPQPFALPVKSLEGLSEDEQEAEIRRAWGEAAQRPSALGAGRPPRG